MLYFLLFVLLILACASFILSTSGLGFIFGAPYVPTRPHIAAAMMKLAGAGPNDVVLDPACGRAHILVAAQNAGAKKVIGYDINPTLIFMCNVKFIWRHFMHRFTENQEAVFKRQSIMHLSDSPEVTVVVLYLLPGLLNKSRPIFAKNLKPDTKIISHAFTFKDIAPRETLNIDKTTLYMYLAKDLAI